MMIGTWKRPTPTHNATYYDDLATRAVGHGHPLEAAIEQAASAYLD